MKNKHSNTAVTIPNTMFDELWNASTPKKMKICVISKETDFHVQGAQTASGFDIFGAGEEPVAKEQIPFINIYITKTIKARKLIIKPLKLLSWIIDNKCLVVIVIIDDFKIGIIKKL